MTGTMNFEGLPGMKRGAARMRPPGTALAEESFAPNPGNLRMFALVPKGLKRGAPLVVVLHGCGQTAPGYAQGAGWAELAAAHGFALLAPEQKAVNNPATCFNWFHPPDIARDEGEAASIAAMVAQMITAHALDPARVFVTGLSAGGAMAAAMLASYPQLFAGGAIVAGLPFGVAGNVRDAMEAMRAAPRHTPHQWGDLVRGAAPQAAKVSKQPWPRISIWHGDADATVNISNARANLAQWADVHGLAMGAARQDTIDGAVRRRWGDVLEEIVVPGMGHGVPIAAADVGEPAPYILETGISSSRRIAEFWGLGEAHAAGLGPSKTKPQAGPKPIHVFPKRAIVTPLSTAAANLKAAQLVRRALRAVWRKPL